MKQFKIILLLVTAVLFASCESNDDAIISQNPVFNIPQQIEPQDNSILSTLTPFMDWTDVQNAISYRVQIARDEGFAQLVEDTSGINVSQYNVPAGQMSDSNSYYWRVRAVTTSDSSKY